MARPKSKPQPNGVSSDLEASLPADTADVTGTSKQDSPLQPGALSTTSISIAQAPVGEQTNKDLAKQELMGLCGKIKRGIMQKGDVSYDSQLVVGGYFQATVTVRCLDGDWKDAVFVGEVCRDKSMAEHSAAAVAVAELRKDDAMMARSSASSQLSCCDSKVAGHMQKFHCGEQFYLGTRWVFRRDLKLLKDEIQKLMMILEVVDLVG
ncbi:unnamed protein product [Cladocopium goreaui]|uniref:DRBM domain-containing protein n=1 Tax=Cladocopium goreaui TaxID=2562237 RepID=A0A9P1CJF8_9DINO|nr:unnamed protein product [Cladocopium goreaui]